MQIKTISSTCQALLASLFWRVMPMPPAPAIELSAVPCRLFRVSITWSAHAITCSREGQESTRAVLSCQSAANASAHM